MKPPANTSKTVKKAKKRGKPTPEETFSQLYAKIQRFKQQNAMLKEEMAYLYSKFEAMMADDEKLLNAARYKETELLIRFIPKKTLANWHKEVLIDWVLGNLRELIANPFSDGARIQSLKGELDCALKTAFKIEPLSAKTVFDEENDIADPHDLDDDWFGFDELDEEDPDEADNDREDYREFEEAFKQRFEQIENENSEQKTKLDDIFKSSAVRKMFRQLSKKFHPDLEQNEALKDEKHLKMAALLDARATHDVLSIIAMHNAEFGSDNHSFSTEEISHLIPLLKNQLEQERQAKDLILCEDPILATVYAWFNASTPQATEKKMAAYKKEIQEKYEHLVITNKHITSIAKLKPFLEARYDYACMEQFDERYLD